jgi:hypothetical protein
VHNHECEQIHKLQEVLLVRFVQNHLFVYLLLPKLYFYVYETQSFVIFPFSKDPVEVRRDKQPPEWLSYLF